MLTTKAKSRLADIKSQLVSHNITSHAAMSKTHPLASYLPTIPPPTTSNTAEGLEPLSYEVDPNSDGKAVYNPPREGKSPYYDTLWYKGGGKTWVDIHIYHQVGGCACVADGSLATQIT